MIVRQSLADVPPGERAVALGSFDGVHRGHQAVIGAAVSAAAARGLRSAVMTFHPPPIAVLRPEVKLVQLSSLSRRAALVAELGVDELVILRFDREFASSTPTGSPRRCWPQTLGARHVSVGENFRYGQGAKGTPARLAEDGHRLGFDVHVEPLLQEAAARSRPRGSASWWARAPSRRPPSCWAGRRGSRAPSCAATAVAASLASRRPTSRSSRARRCPASASTPARPTCPGRATRRRSASATTSTFTDDRSQVRVEAYLLDFDADIYGSPIRLDLTHRLRDELRFDSVDALLEQLTRDVEAVRALAE